MAKLNVNDTDKLVFDLRMHQIDYNKQKEESLRHQIAEKYGVPVKNVEVNFIPLTTNDDGEKISLAADVIENIQDPKFQSQLFREYVKAKGLEDVDFEGIDAIDAQVNALVDFDAYATYKTYKFKYVKWDNYLSYGSGNMFDFTKLHGLVLLNGQPENQCGKTTFAIDLLRFALFGRAHKSPDLSSVFNIYRPEDTQVMVEACIEIDGVDYVIRRTVTRPPLAKRTEKSKPKQKVEYFRLTNGNYEEMENAEGESGRETNKIISDSVGTLEDYNLIISATAKTLGDLLDMGQTDKGRLFSRWLGLLSIERKEEIAKDMWKKNICPKLLSNTYNKTSINGEINDLKNCIADNDKGIAHEEELLAESNNRLAGLNNRKTEVLSSMKDVSDTLTKDDVTTLENRKAQTETDLARFRAELSSLKVAYMDVKDVKFDPAELDTANETYDSLTKEKHSIELANAELKANIKMKRDEVARINALVAEGKCPTCGQDIDADRQNENIGKIQAEINSLINQGVANKGKIDGIAAKMAETSEQIRRLTESQGKVNTKSSLELKMIAVKSKIDKAKLEIADYERRLAEVEKNKENIRINNEITLTIKTIDESIRVETQTKESHIRAIEVYKGENKQHGKSISDRETIIRQLDEEERTIRNWNLYQQMVGKNGIVKLVLKKALPVINNEVSRLLNGLCDFKVEVSVGDDNFVHMDLVRGGQHLDLGRGASGFESVMASIALRHSLAGIATMPKPNFTVLDEVLDGVAVSNHENVHELFKRISKSYDFIIHITHNELLSDWHDCNICVTKGDDMVSHISLK